MSNRDTQFQGFAKSVVEELTSLELEYMGVTIDNLSTMSRHYREEWEKIVVRRAYDLACHVVTHLDEDVAWRKCKGHTASQIVENDIPDMTELLKE
jgi:hypothetical protein